MAENEMLRRVVFISRAGEDSEIARHVAESLRDAGFETFLQDEDFGHTSFMECMAEGFRHVDRDGCLVALLSEAYQRKPQCLKEARYPLISDPSNKGEKLIVLRLDNTAPEDFLKDIPYIDLSELSHTESAFDEAVISAVVRSFSNRESTSGKARAAVAARRDTKVEKLMICADAPDQNVLSIPSPKHVVGLIAEEYIGAIAAFENVTKLISGDLIGTGSTNRVLHAN